MSQNRCPGSSPANKIQIRRARPSALAFALALLLTMLFVYAIARPALPSHATNAVSAQSAISTELRMEGMEARFRIEARCSDPLQARILAARCAQDGGAGLILTDGEGYAIVREAGDASEAALLRSAAGLTLQLEGSAAELAAVTDAVAFLRAQASETGVLAAALESGDTDASSLAALMRVYQTQGQRVLAALNSLGSQPALDLFRASVSACLTRIASAIDSTSPSSLRLVHAAACAEWLGILEGLRSGDSVP